MDRMASNAAAKNGPASRAPAAESGIKVQSLNATTECEFGLAANQIVDTGSNLGSDNAADAARPRRTIGTTTASRSLATALSRERASRATCSVRPPQKENPCLAE